MAYRVETATRSLPELFIQDGPTCLHLTAAFEMVETLKGDRRIRRLRIRDMSRNPAKRDPIIFYMDKGDQHG
jgi:hypothetical protein